MERSPATILIIDDEPLGREWLAAQLGDSRIRVVEAGGGDEGVELAALIAPDLILLDLLMPGVDGVEACRRLKADGRTRNIPVIFITARDDIEAKRAAFGVGGVDFITKPLHRDELLARVSHHLANLRTTQALMERLRRYESSAEPQPDSDIPSEPMARNRIGDSPASSHRESATHEDKLVSVACEILLKNISSPPSLGELVQFIGTNRNTLTRNFNRAYGMSVYSWLREQRLKLASRLLHETNWTISQIGSAVGYSDPNHFSTSYRRRFGLSPRKYRKKE